MAQQGKSQRDKRRDMNPTDQFGRVWLAAIDRDSFEPTGLVQPAGWSDPLATPQQYLRTLRDNHGNPQLGRIEIDGTRWINDQTNAIKEWKTRLWNIGRDTQKNAFKPENAEHDEYLLYLTGPKPWPAPEVLKKAFAGDKRLLGIEPLDRETRLLIGRFELEDLEPAADEPKMLEGQEGEAETEEQLAAQERALLGGGVTIQTGDFKGFISACLSKGMNMKQAAVAWKEFKAALKEA